MAPDTSKTADKAAATTSDEDVGLSRQAGFSSYEELEVEPANPPNGRLVLQKRGKPAEGPVPLFGEK